MVRDVCDSLFPPVVLGHCSAAMTRRAFLAGVAQTNLIWASSKGTDDERKPTSTRPATRPAAETRPTTLPGESVAKSIVADVRARELIDGAIIHRPLLREMIDEAVRTATGAATTEKAWRGLLKPTDVVAIKLDQFGYEGFGTTDAFVEPLMAAIGQAGVTADRIMLIEAPAALAKRLRTRPQVFGWSETKASWPGGKDHLARWLAEVTTIINVPFLRTHHTAGLCGAMLNLARSVVRQPGQYEASAWTPAAGRILALPQVRSKIRLHLVNALRASFEGAAPGPENTWTHAGLLAGTDPVAIDTVSVDIINEQRAARKLPPIGDAEGHVPHVHAAAETGLGTDDPDLIDIRRPRVT